jgi:hypothetical protein
LGRHGRSRLLSPGVHVPLKAKASFFIILIGYSAGILTKKAQERCSGPVLVLYVVNALKMIIDSALFFCNRRYGR